MNTCGRKRLVPAVKRADAVGLGLDGEMSVVWVDKDSIRRLAIECYRRQKLDNG